MSSGIGEEESTVEFVAETEERGQRGNEGRAAELRNQMAGRDDERFKWAPGYESVVMEIQKPSRSPAERTIGFNRWIDVHMLLAASPCQVDVITFEDNRIAADIRQDMKMVYDENGESAPRIDLDLLYEEMAVAALWRQTEEEPGADDHWYRAKVLRIDGGKVFVRFLDYGNCVWIVPDDLRPLHKAFFSPVALAIPCFFNGALPSHEDTAALQDDYHNEVLELLGEDGLCCVRFTPTNVRPGTYSNPKRFPVRIAICTKEDITDNMLMMADSLIQLKKDHPLAVSTAPPESVTVSGLGSVTSSLGEGESETVDCEIAQNPAPLSEVSPESDVNPASALSTITEVSEASASPQGNLINLKSEKSLEADAGGNQSSAPNPSTVESNEVKEKDEGMEVLVPMTESAEVKERSGSAASLILDGSVSDLLGLSSFGATGSTGTHDSIVTTVAPSSSTKKKPKNAIEDLLDLFPSTENPPSAEESQSNGLAESSRRNSGTTTPAPPDKARTSLTETHRCPLIAVKAASASGSGGETSQMMDNAKDAAGGDCATAPKAASPDRPSKSRHATSVAASLTARAHATNSVAVGQLAGGSKTSSQEAQKAEAPFQSIENRSESSRAVSRESAKSPVDQLMMANLSLFSTSPCPPKTTGSRAASSADEGEN